MIGDRSARLRKIEVRGLRPPPGPGSSSGPSPGHSRVPAQLEPARLLRQATDLVRQIARGGGCLFDHRRILLRRPVHQADRRGDLGYRGGLYPVVARHRRQQLMHVPDIGGYVR